MLSEATGVPASTLRTWEQRYGFPKPERSPTGQRRYDEQQVAMINQLVSRLQAGERIGEAIEQLSLHRQTPRQAGKATAADGQLSYWQFLEDQMLAAVARFDEASLNAILSEALSLFSVQEVTYQLLCPTLFRLGERWSTQCAGIAEEHFFSAFLRGRVGAIAHHQSLQLGSGPQLLCCCLPGEIHDLGLLIFCLEANIQRLRTIFLGADVPLEQVETVVADERVGVEAVLFAATIKPSRTLLEKELPALVQRLQVPVFVGGRASLKYKDAFETAGLQVVGNEMPAGAGLIAQALSHSLFERRRDAAG